MPNELTWLGHASFRITSDTRVYIDPWKIDGEPHDGDLVIVSHGHYDHCSPEDVRKVAKPTADILAPADAAAALGRGTSAEFGTKVTMGGAIVETVRAYNPEKTFHPRRSNWFGVVLTVDGARIYYAGDTDVVPEMGDLRDIDVALLPVGGTYTMDPAEAARACRMIQPAVAIPYHWGDIVGDETDARTFADKAPCEVRILKPGESYCFG